MDPIEQETFFGKHAHLEKLQGIIRLFWPPENFLSGKNKIREKGNGKYVIFILLNKP